MSCCQKRFTTTWAKRVFCGAVSSAARRSRESSGFIASEAAALSELIWPSGHLGSTVLPGLSVT